MKLLFWKKEKKPEMTIEEQIEHIICGMFDNVPYDSRREILSTVVKNVIPGHRVYRRRILKRVKQVNLPGGD